MTQRGHLVLDMQLTEWVLAEHITTPRRSWREVEYAKPAPKPEPEPDVEYRSSDFNGVIRREGQRRWSCEFVHNHQRYTVGRFDTEREAAYAHDSFCRAHGFKRQMNFPDFEKEGWGA